MHKDVKVLVRTAELQGFRVHHTSKGHLRFLCPDGGIVIGAPTPSDPRSSKNLLSQLRRHGLQDRTPKKEKPVVVVEQLNPAPAVAVVPARPWGHWTDEQVRDLRRQGYSREFILARTGR